MHSQDCFGAYRTTYSGLLLNTSSGTKVVCGSGYVRLLRLRDLLLIKLCRWFAEMLYEARCRSIISFCFGGEGELKFAAESSYGIDHREDNGIFSLSSEWSSVSLISTLTCQHECYSAEQPVAADADNDT